jgi:hypothetical protein
MSIRLPLTAVLNFTDTSTSGTANQTVLLPQDTDNVSVKLSAANFAGTNPTCDVYIQTSDDGGTTWYDMANMGQLTSSLAASNARWAYFSTVGQAKRTQGASWLDIGGAAASSTGIQAYSGLPLLGRNLRVFLKYGGTQLVNAGVTVNIFANSQSASAS